MSDMRYAVVIHTPTPTFVIAGNDAVALFQSRDDAIKCCADIMACQHLGYTVIELPNWNGIPRTFQGESRESESDPLFPTIGASMIAAERERQVKAEGYDTAHDDSHDQGQLLEAALTYIRSALWETYPNSDWAARRNALNSWPWEPDSFKPDWNNPIRNLTKAGALIAAEIDRLSRLAK